MITNLKEAKEKLMNLGYRFDGAEEVLIDDTRSKIILLKLRGKV